jgi:hypothetical protein
VKKRRTDSLFGDLVDSPTSPKQLDTTPIDIAPPSTTTTTITTKPLLSSPSTSRIQSPLSSPPSSPLVIQPTSPEEGTATFPCLILKDFSRSPALQKRPL